MEEFKGTKGEWKIKHSESKNAFNIIGTIVGGNYKIARVPYSVDEKYSDTINDIFRTEAERNARLIAAAPDLLHACQNSLLQLELGLMGDSGTANILRKAINKAIGE